MTLAREFKPGAITLDINLPDMAGWTILDRLKHDPATRHIPVHIISGDDNRRRGIALGAMTYLEKSVTNESLVEAFATIEHSVQKRVKKLLVVCGDERRAGGDDRDHRRRPTSKSSAWQPAGEALAVVKQQYLDGIVIHLDIGGHRRRWSWSRRSRLMSGAYAPPIILMCNRAAQPRMKRWTSCALARNSVVKIAHYARTSAG